MAQTAAQAGGGDATITALRFYGKGDIRLEKTSKVPCGADDVRLKVAYCGICGSDIHEFLGGPIFPPAQGKSHPFTGVSLPVTMGHEFAGTVIETGAKVSNVSVGQPVAVNPALDHRHYGTDLCTGCQAGRYNICSGTATYGLSAPGGGFSDEIVVKATNCLAVPSNVTLKAASLAEPLAVAHHCIALSGFTKGQTVLICGAGPIGLALLLILRVLGASYIIVTEVAERRIAQARKFGADAVINPLQTTGPSGGNPALAAAQALEGGGVDVAFDATGLQSTLDLSIASTKAGGTIFNVAIHEKPLSLQLNDISKAEKKLLGGICYTSADFEAVLKLMEDGVLEPEQMITSIVPLTEIVQGGFDELINNRESHVKILIQPQE